MCGLHKRVLIWDYFEYVIDARSCLFRRWFLCLISVIGILRAQKPFKNIQA